MNPGFDASGLIEALQQVPARFNRQGRIKLIGHVAIALMSGKPPERAAALFVAGALQSWLENGGSLERDYLRVTAKSGSHHTPAAVWQTLLENPSSRGATSPDAGPMLATSSKAESAK